MPPPGQDSERPAPWKSISAAACYVIDHFALRPERLMFICSQEDHGRLAALFSFEPSGRVRKAPWFAEIRERFVATPAVRRTAKPIAQRGRDARAEQRKGSDLP